MTPNGGRRRPGGPDRGPRPLADALDEAVASLAPRRGGGAQRAQAAPASAWATLFHDWEAVVGPSLARHVTPQRLDADVLVVSVDRPPWATQVRALGPQILARVAERIAAAPTRLEVVVRPR